MPVAVKAQTKLTAASRSFLDPPVGDQDAAAGGAGDRYGADVGLDGAVVAEFGEDVGAGQVTEAEEAGDDLVVGINDLALSHTAIVC